MDRLAAPDFHHLHLNSVDPDAAIEEPCPLGNTRAVTIEGPSREAIELVEAV